VKLVLLQLSPAPDHAGHHLDTVLVLEQPNVQFENAENVGKQVRIWPRKWTISNSRIYGGEFSLVE